MVKLHVRVKPSSFKDEIVIDEKRNWVIKIKAKPIDGEANLYLIKFLSKEWDISRSNFHVEKGATSQYKTIHINLDEMLFDLIINKYKNEKHSFK
jgi:hypothetical protein